MTGAPYIRAILTSLALALVLAALGHAQAPEPGSGELTIALGGDVIFDAPIEYVLRTRGLSADETSSYDELFADLRPSLSRADLAIVNLETPVAVRTRERSEERDYPTFAAPPAFLAALRGAGADVVTVANNHAYDQGVAGLAETLANARRLGLAASGVADDRGYTVSAVRGLRVATVSLTQGTNHRVEHGEAASPRVHFFDEERLTRLVTHARAHADVVVVALHFTDTGDRYPTRGMARWGHRAAEAGADVVVGHGPHVPASLEWADVGGRRVPILHSLGNLVAAMQAEEHAERTRGVHVRDSVVVELRVRVERGRVTVTPPRTHAFWIDDARSPSGAAPFTRPVAITSAASPALTARSERLAALFGGSAAAPTVLVSARGVAQSPSTSSSTSTSPSTSPSTSASASRPASPPHPSSPGTPLAVSFRCGSATETAVDDAAIAGWVARLRAEPRLTLEVVGERCEGEPESLAVRRARRAAGLIAIRGPSRSRFSHRAGGVGSPRVLVSAR